MRKAKKAFVIANAVAAGVIIGITCALIFSLLPFVQTKDKQATDITLGTACIIDSAESLKKELEKEGTLKPTYTKQEDIGKIIITTNITTEPLITSSDTLAAYQVNIDVKFGGTSKRTQTAQLVIATEKDSKKYG